MPDAVASGISEEMADDSAGGSDDARLQELSSRLREMEDRYLRLRADFENFKRRTAQEQLEARTYTAADVAARLLPVLDDAERALTQVPEHTDESWLQGLRLTVQKLRDVLASLGVEPIEAVGTPFDPALHEAMGTEDTAEHPEGAVASEMRRGYRLRDRVVRPSLVKVARRPDGPRQAAPSPHG
jgi:molecular chaperone GrpE